MNIQYVLKHKSVYTRIGFISLLLIFTQFCYSQQSPTENREDFEEGVLKYRRENCNINYLPEKSSKSDSTIIVETHPITWFYVRGIFEFEFSGYTLHRALDYFRYADALREEYYNEMLPGDEKLLGKDPFLCHTFGPNFYQNMKGRDEIIVDSMKYLIDNEKDIIKRIEKNIIELKQERDTIRVKIEEIEDVLTKAKANRISMAEASADTYNDINHLNQVLSNLGTPSQIIPTGDKKVNFDIQYISKDGIDKVNLGVYPLGLGCTEEIKKTSRLLAENLLVEVKGKVTSDIEIPITIIGTADGNKGAEAFGLSNSKFLDAFEQDKYGFIAHSQVSQNQVDELIQGLQEGNDENVNIPTQRLDLQNYLDSIGYRMSNISLAYRRAYCAFEEVEKVFKRKYENDKSVKLVIKLRSASFIHLGVEYRGMRIVIETDGVFKHNRAEQKRLIKKEQNLSRQIKRKDQEKQKIKDAVINYQDALDNMENYEKKAMKLRKAIQEKQ